PDRPIASRVGLQGQSIGVFPSFAPWTEVLPHDVVIRGPIVVALGPQPSLPNPVVRYFPDLQV
ncbi:MAG: hypothetical protein ACXU84_12025, partial [Xanthobacteraceae bacterium]